MNPKLNEITDIINNLRLEHDQNFRDNFCRKIDVKCNINFLDKIKNEKNTTINDYHVHRGIKKTITASQGRYDLIKQNEMIILIEGIVYKNVINTYMKCNNFPILWKKFFLNIANKREDVNKFCNRPFKRFDQHCRQWYLYNLVENNTEVNYNNILDDIPNMKSIWNN